MTFRAASSEQTKDLSGRAFWVRFRDFLGRKIWQYFLVGLIQEGVLFGQIQINLRIRGWSAYASRVVLRIV